MTFFNKEQFFFYIEWLFICKSSSVSVWGFLCELFVTMPIVVFFFLVSSNIKRNHTDMPRDFILYILYSTKCQIFHAVVWCSFSTSRGPLDLLSSSSSSGARSGTDIGGHASPNICVIRQLQKI